MFKKKPNIKPLSPLRSSDRRKIADQIIKDFAIKIPKSEEQVVSGDNDNEQTSPAQTLSGLRNSLLPENALSARFTTTTGPDLKQVTGTLFVGSYTSEDQRILWYRVEERLIPTVYTLWHHPRLLPLLHTQQFVIKKLQTGSPLMTPGLARGPPFPLKATKGAVVAVASVDKPSVPVVVGICDIDIASLQQIHGAKGHAVRTEHWDGDEIWRWSMTGKPAVSAPEYIEGWNVEIGIDSLEEKSQHLTIEDEDDDGEEGGVQLSSEESSKRPNVYVNGENAEPFEGLDEEKEMSTSEIDNAFWQAFLYGVQKARNKHKDDQHHGLSFPIPQSLVISNLVLPFLPIHTARHTAALQIKKTSWKNAKKFIKALHKQNLLKSKDRDGGECVVLDIDFDDPAVVSFVPYKLPKKDTVGAEPGAGGAGKATAANSTSSDTSVGQHLQKISLYRPKEGLSAIFEAANASVKALYLPTELRPIITSYIESENLISGTNKQLVNLNPILANAVFDGHSSLDREVIAKGTVPRNALIDRILQSCSPFWVILHNNETRDSVKAKVGHPPKIQITHETRSGNKTVTRISGVEVFYVNPHLLAEELQKSCASSTSVNQLVGSSPKNPVQEIMVQGSQKDVVIKALEKRGVHRQWIEMLDKTKGKKR